MTMKSIKAIFRRGQTVKLDSGLDDLSRTSSVNNLSIDVKNKGAKPRKSESRDRIDRIAVDFKKSDGQGTLTKNNNQLEAGTSESSSYSLDSLQRQLQDMANEKSNLALQLGEKNGQLNLLQKEIEKLKVIKDDSHVRLEHLNEENTLLRNRLRDIAHSPLSDNEKQQLLYESHRQHSSAPASITTNAFEDVNNEDGDHNTCPTPDWDKHSSSNASEVSVACLQDKINQMQETHYSTNEELQATLQELTDLQRQLTELQQENERLNDEKTLMFDSLCRQTERLNDSRSEVENLKVLLYREKDDSDSNYEREQKLVTLLKTAQDERESLLHNLEQFRMDMNEKQREIDVKDENIRSCSERNRTLESGLEQKQTEFKQLDLELIQFRDKFSNKQIEVNRLMDLLENARGKIAEMEETRKKLGDKSELDEILDAVRKEKDTLEEEVAHLKEQCARARNEGEKLKEHVDDLQEECKVTRNNAKSIQSDLEYKCQKLKQEKSIVTEQLQQFQETINELQMQNQFQLEEKRQLQAVLSETQRNLNEAERKNRSLEMDLCELKKHKDIENEEWEKFQNDLLTSVRVANDFKTEAQQDLQKMILENKAHREKVRQLEAQIDKLKVQKSQEEFPKLGLTKLPKHKLFAASKVKKRSKIYTKTPTLPETKLLHSLNELYHKIDPNLPTDLLSSEQYYVRFLKNHFADESFKTKPKARKPKNQLTISKPLLNSIILNPKLEKIVYDNSIPIIENDISHLYRKEFHTKNKSKSCEQLCSLKRTSSILPIDSISNYRASLPNESKGRNVQDITFCFNEEFDDSSAEVSLSSTSGEFNLLTGEIGPFRKFEHNVQNLNQNAINRDKQKTEDELDLMIETEMNESDQNLNTTILNIENWNFSDNKKEEVEQPHIKKTEKLKAFQNKQPEEHAFINQYKIGIVAPVSLRLAYTKVLQEIKNKFVHPVEEENVDAKDSDLMSTSEKDRNQTTGNIKEPEFILPRHLNEGYPTINLKEAQDFDKKIEVTKDSSQHITKNNEIVYISKKCITQDIGKTFPKNKTYLNKVVGSGELAEGVLTTLQNNDLHSKPKNIRDSKDIFEPVETIYSRKLDFASKFSDQIPNKYINYAYMDIKESPVNKYIEDTPVEQFPNVSKSTETNNDDVEPLNKNLNNKTNLIKSSKETYRNAPVHIEKHNKSGKLTNSEETSNLEKVLTEKHKSTPIKKAFSNLNLNYQPVYIKTITDDMLTKSEFNQNIFKATSNSSVTETETNIQEPFDIGVGTPIQIDDQNSLGKNNIMDSNLKIRKTIDAIDIKQYSNTIFSIPIANNEELNIAKEVEETPHQKRMKNKSNVDQLNESRVSDMDETPKVVEFLPIVDNSRMKVCNSFDSGLPENFDTLDRVTTFHVLNNPPPFKSSGNSAELKLPQCIDSKFDSL